jgi:hypothetical protein
MRVLDNYGAIKIIKIHKHHRRHIVKLLETKWLATIINNIMDYIPST